MFAVARIAPRLHSARCAAAPVARWSAVAGQGGVAMAVRCFSSAGSAPEGEQGGSQGWKSGQWQKSQQRGPRWPWTMAGTSVVMAAFGASAFSSEEMYASSPDSGGARGGRSRPRNSREGYLRGAAGGAAQTTAFVCGGWPPPAWRRLDGCDRHPLCGAAGGGTSSTPAASTTAPTWFVPAQRTRCCAAAPLCSTAASSGSGAPSLASWPLTRLSDPPPHTPPCRSPY
jgi:hypothetical protein